MKLYFLIAVDVDRNAVVQDNPPEDISAAVQSELLMAITDGSARGALGIQEASVAAVTFPELTKVQPLPWTLTKITSDGSPSFPGEHGITDANGVMLTRYLTVHEAQMICAAVNLHATFERQQHPILRLRRAGPKA